MNKEKTYRLGFVLFTLWLINNLILLIIGLTNISYYLSIGLLYFWSWVFLSIL